jgi:S-adenosylmethionine:tRNA ribosyltransferase-isomerase
MLKVSDLEYVLPEGHIARQAALPRDSARLLVVKKSDPGVMVDAFVRDLPRFLQSGDVMVANTSAVIPARLIGFRTDTQGHTEGLFLSSFAGEDAGEVADRVPVAEREHHWKVLLKAKRLKEGATITLTNDRGEPSGVLLELIARLPAGEEVVPWHVRVVGAGVDGGGAGAIEILSRVGLPPLPPYILAARKRDSGEGRVSTAREIHTRFSAGESEQTSQTQVPRVHVGDASAAADRGTYQTVYANLQAAGSVAAPTAGLHFTHELLEKLASSGIARHEVVLHVGTGTFKPVETEFVEQHVMHKEWCRWPRETAGAMLRARQSGKRVLAVGTTTARTLESFPAIDERSDQQAWTNLLITPGKAFAHVDILMTNFHLPRSTLMAMVGAFLDQANGGSGDGVARLKAIYAHAIAQNYRFYSYGDAMLILP